MSQDIFVVIEHLRGAGFRYLLCHAGWGTPVNTEQGWKRYGCAPWS